MAVQSTKSRAGDIDGPKPYEFIGFGDIDGPKPYEFIWFGDIYGSKPYEFIWFGDIYGSKPYEFIMCCLGFSLTTRGSGGSWNLPWHPMLRNSASGPEVGLPGRISAGF